MRRLLSMLILVMAAGTLVPAAGASAGAAPAPAPGSQRFGVRLLDVPVSDAHNPRGLRYIIDYLATGTTIHRRVLVVNLETRTARFSIYPDAASIADGLFTGDSGETRSALTTWITLQHRSLTLRPHASATDMVTIRVPRGATRGEQYGEIWAQQIAHARTVSGIAVTEVARVGVRIYLAVGTGGAPPTAFTITSLTGRTSASGQPLLTAHVHNTGGRAVDLSGLLRLAGGPGGITAGPLREQQVLTLAPRQSGNVTFIPRRGLPAGPWQATVTLESGFTRVTAHATVQFSHSTTATWARLPVMGAGLMACLLVLALVLLLHTRQIRRAHA